MSQSTAGARFRAALAAEKPLQIPGAINANHALLAKSAGFKAIYLSGGGVAAGSLGLPDLGISGLDDVLTDVRRITDVCDLPLLVDVDTGFGPSAFNVARTTRSLIKFGAGAMHIEDQVGAKRCGHRPGKEIVSQQEMVDRIKAAVDARTDAGFRDHGAHRRAAVEGLDKRDRARGRYVEAGADMVFPEAMTDARRLRKVAAAVKVPVLANLTEFGSTPFCSPTRIARSAGVAIVLYACGAFRAMNKAALNFYETIRRDGTRRTSSTPCRRAWSSTTSIGYHAYEDKLDALFAQAKTR
jgi:methylisocitrate lyase